MSPLMPCDESPQTQWLEAAQFIASQLPGSGIGGRPRWVSGCSQVVTGLRPHLSWGRVSSELAHVALGWRPRSDM